MRTPTQIALSGLHLAPIGNPVTEPSQCVCCGVPIDVGEMGTQMNFGANFMDGRALQHAAGRKSMVCGSCAPFFGKKVMGRILAMVVSDEGAYSIFKSEYRAWFLHHPPKPPFVVVFTDAKSQHLIWKAPVTLDVDYWQVQLGRRSLTIRRQTLFRAVAASKALCAAKAEAAALMPESGGKRRKAPMKVKPALSPFISLDFKLGDMLTGVIRPDFKRFAVANGMTDKLRILETLSTGELWAIGSLLFNDGSDLAPPPLIDVSSDFTSSKDDDDAEGAE